jgi:hypothetical protein
LSAHVESQKYRGVAVDNPRVVEYTKNMIKNGEKNEKIAEVVGIPHEVVEKIRIDVEGRPNK